MVIPARNEEASLAAAVRSVLHQTQPAHRIVVVVNNSDDRTEQVARGFANQGVEVVVMAANPDRKAGALNHVITPLLVQMDERDAILTMDADTELAPDFIKADMTLVRDVHRNSIKRELIATIRRFSDSTGITLIAEGVETHDELKSLRELGVRCAQGFLFARPGAPPHVPDWDVLRPSTED